MNTSQDSIKIELLEWGGGGSISSAVFEDMGHKVVFDGKRSHISLRENGKKFASIPLRCEGRLRYLDYLVPDDASEHKADIALLSDSAFLDEVTETRTVEYLEADDKGHFELAKEEEEDGVTRLNTEPSHNLTVNLPNVRDSQYLEHRRVCHIGKQLYDRTVAAVDGLPEVTHDPNCPCCAIAKSTKKRRNRHAFRERADKPMQRLHMDLMGKFKHQSLGDANFALVIVDDYSRYTEVCFNGSLEGMKRNK